MAKRMRGTIPRKPVAVIFERLILERVNEEGVGGKEALAHEIAASGRMTYQSAQRRLYAIVNGHTVGRNGRAYKQRQVKVETVDSLLTALDRPDLWSQLERYLPKVAPPSRRELDEEADRTCASCRRPIDWKYDLAVRVEMSFHGRGHRRQWWSLCASCFAEGWQPARPPDCTGKRRARVPDAELLTLYRSYVRAQVGLEYLIERGRICERYGYPNTRAAAMSITAAWRYWGWPMHRRNASKRLNHRARLARGIVGGRIPADELRQLNVLHTRGQKLSINELARRTYERYGFKTPNTCAVTISEGWKALGLKARSRIEMTVEMSTKNGLSPRDSKERRRRRLAAGLTVKGHERQPTCTGKLRGGKKPCTRPAMAGSDYCWSHNPETLAVRKERYERIRAKLHPETLLSHEEWLALRDELIEARRLVGSWQPFAAELGVHWRTVWTYSCNPHLKVSTQRAARITAAIDAVLEQAQAA